jgi:hypothetical protein
VKGIAREAPLVLTVTVKAELDVPLTVTELGATAQVASAGAPLQLKATVPLKPLAGETCKLYVALCPAVTAVVRLAEDREKSGVEVLTFPLKASVCGLLVALSATRTEAFSELVTDGVNVTLIKQFEPAASDAGQLFVSAKSDAFVPMTEIVVILNVALPVFVSVTDCGELAVPTARVEKFTEEGEKPTAGLEVVVPLIANVCGLLVALSATRTEAFSELVTDGVNVTLIKQFEPAASDAGQLFVSAKSDAFVPMMEIVVIFNAALPVFVRVTDCGELVVPTARVEKLTEEGEKSTAGLEVVDSFPLSANACGLSVALSATRTEALSELVTDGVNVTLIKQFEPAASDTGQLFVSAKSDAFVPMTEIEVILNVALPVFVSVTDCGELVVPIDCVRKANEDREKSTAGFGVVEFGRFKA